MPQAEPLDPAPQKGRAASLPVDNPGTKASDRWFMILLTVFEVGASVLVVHEVKNHGGSDFAAYMWALLPPLLGALVY